MAEYTTEQMTALTQISNILTANGLTVKDLPEGTSLNNTLAACQKSLSEIRSNFNELMYRIVPKFYNEMVDQTSEEEAYNWVEDNIFSRYTNETYNKWVDYFNEAGIKLKKYKVVEVSVNFKVIMPDDAYDGDWENYVDVSDIDFGYADYDVIDDDMSADEVDGRFSDLVNCIDDLR